jgi:hypothetical protein
MTEFDRQELLRRIDAYKTSDAPIEVREAAINKLSAQLMATTSVDQALADFHESQSDLSDFNQG